MLKSLLRRAGAALVITPLLAAGAATTANAETTEPTPDDAYPSLAATFVRIQARDTALCLDADGADHVFMAFCNLYSNNQKWRLIPTASGNLYRNVATGRCLTPIWSISVTTTACYTEDRLQRWADYTGGGSTLLVNDRQGRCLTSNRTGSGRPAGTAWMAACSETQGNQRWFLHYYAS